MTDPPPIDAVRRPPRPAFSRDEAGAVVLEYAMVAALVAIMAIGAVILFAESATSVWTGVGQEVGNALGG